jgi:hypothetical protein
MINLFILPYKEIIKYGIDCLTDCLYPIFILNILLFIFYFICLFNLFSLTLHKIKKKD